MVSLIVAYDNIVLITIDQKEVDDYLDMYFEKYPGRRKKPIKGSIPPSLNQWSNMNKYMKNDLKQSWDTFMMHVVDRYGFSNLGIDKAKVTCTFYFRTRHRRDLDNYVLKLAMDGLVRAGLFTDDNCHVICPLILDFGGYDKDNPRFELKIEREDL